MNEQGLIPCESWQYIRGAHAFRHSTQEYSIFPFISLSPLLFLLPLPQPSQRIYPTYTPHNSSRIEFIHYANAEKPPNENELPEQAWATRLAWLRCSSAPLRWPQHAHCLIAYRGCDSGRGQWSTWDRGIQGRGWEEAQQPHEFCMINERHGWRLIYQKVVCGLRGAWVMYLCSRLN